MHKTLASFINGFYLDYWTHECHPLIRPLIEEYLPSLLSDAGGWTAFLAEPPDEALIEQKPITIFFKKHPNWKSQYEEVCFALMLKILHGKPIGLYTVQLVFYYPTKESLEIAVENLITTCNQLAAGLTKNQTENGFSIHSTESNVNAYFKTDYHAVAQKHRLFFSTVPFFFEYD
jgi:hypothetical protein